MGQAFQLQEMGEAGTGSLEHGIASGEVFWMKYPYPFLTYYYKTFPDKLSESSMGAETTQSTAATDARGGGDNATTGAEDANAAEEGGSVALKQTSVPHLYLNTSN